MDHQGIFKAHYRFQIEIPRLSLELTHGESLFDEVMNWEPWETELKTVELDLRQIKDIFDKAHEELDAAMLKV